MTLADAFATPPGRRTGGKRSYLDVLLDQLDGEELEAVRYALTAQDETGTFIWSGTQVARVLTDEGYPVTEWIVGKWRRKHVSS